VNELTFGQETKIPLSYKVDFEVFGDYSYPSIQQESGKKYKNANVSICAHHKDTSDNFSVYSVSPLFRYKVQAQIIDDHNIKFFVIFDWSFECNNSNLQQKR
jgi:hypothetical protein